MGTIIRFERPAAHWVGLHGAMRRRQGDRLAWEEFRRGRAVAAVEGGGNDSGVRNGDATRQPGDGVGCTASCTREVARPDAGPPHVLERIELGWTDFLTVFQLLGPYERSQHGVHQAIDEVLHGSDRQEPDAEAENDGAGGDKQPFDCRSEPKRAHLSPAHHDDSADKEAQTEGHQRGRADHGKATRFAMLANRIERMREIRVKGVTVVAHLIGLRFGGNGRGEKGDDLRIGIGGDRAPCPEARHELAVVHGEAPEGALGHTVRGAVRLDLTQQFGQINHVGDLMGRSPFVNGQLTNRNGLSILRVYSDG